MQVLRNSNVAKLIDMNAEEALEFLNLFIKLEVSRAFSIILVPTIVDIETSHHEALFTLQLIPMSDSDANNVFLEILSVSFKDEKLSKWSNRIKIIKSI